MAGQNDSCEAKVGDAFWMRKGLDEMSREEWESLCDGCGRCCTLTLEEDDGTIAETSLCCRLFDPVRRRCTRYDDRLRLVPECVKVTPRNARKLGWMPESCAYRRLAEGRGLAEWHPLVSGDPESVVRAGIAVPADLTDETKVRERDLWRYVTAERD